MKKITIAIDGFSSSGKSTMAKALAREIGYIYIDSGAMYRAVTLYALRHGLIAPDGTVREEELVSALPDIKIEFRYVTPGEAAHTFLNGEDVERQIRGMEVSNAVSPVSAIPAVRHDLVKKQQAFGAAKGIVMDGRDIGTTVFPDAEMKVFVAASPRERARRRVEELRAKGRDVSFDEVFENVVSRDRIDRSRSESPLRKADDAVELDNTGMTIDEQNRWLLDLYNQRSQS